MNVTVGNQIYDSDAYRRIISSQIFQNQTLWIIISLEHEKYQTFEYISTKIGKTSEKVQIKAIHRRYKYLWHVCIQMKKALEDILYTAHN